MVLILLLMLMLAAPHASEPSLYSASPLGALLHHARLATASGDDAAALEYLSALEARLLAGEGMPAEQAVGALALLGDLRLRAGDREGAEAALRYMLGRYPGRGLCPPCPECPTTVEASAPMTEGPPTSGEPQRTTQPAED